MTFVYIYFLIGCLLTLAFFPWEGKRLETLVALLTVIFWPVVFYYAFQAARAQAAKSRSQGGDKDPPPSDPGQAG